ncbi:DUF192 domain-containing protein [Candidatus Woesearchaeota archaeon]|nr:DUF192 domain-containing protein [Candidatus Woesearchaeota archaeon]
MRYATFFGLAGLLVFSLLLIACSQSPQACVNDKCFDVDIADEPEEHTKGLQGRDELGYNSGMLFIYNETRLRGYWMKDTKIPLDIIWIDENMKIVYHYENAEPCLKSGCVAYYPPNSANSRYALEINGGMFKKYGFKDGDEVVLQNIQI